MRKKPSSIFYTRVHVRLSGHVLCRRDFEWWTEFKLFLLNIAGKRYGSAATVHAFPRRSDRCGGPITFDSNVYLPGGVFLPSSTTTSTSFSTGISSESPSMPSQFSALWMLIRSWMSCSSVLPMTPPRPFSGPNTTWLYSGSFFTGKPAGRFCR